jgi:hypothetical protein
LILNTLKLNLSIPTPFVFMQSSLKTSQSDKKLEQLSFFVELLIVEYEMLEFPSFFISSCCVLYCSMHVLFMDSSSEDGLVNGILATQKVSYCESESLAILARILSFLPELLSMVLVALLAHRDCSRLWSVSTKRQQRENSQAYIGNIVHLSLATQQNVNLLIFFWIPNYKAKHVQLLTLHDFVIGLVRWGGEYSYSNSGCIEN